MLISKFSAPRSVVLDGALWASIGAPIETSTVIAGWCVVRMVGMDHRRHVTGSGCKVVGTGSIRVRVTGSYSWRKGSRSAGQDGRRTAVPGKSRWRLGKLAIWLSTAIEWAIRSTAWGRTGRTSCHHWAAVKWTVTSWVVSRAVRMLLLWATSRRVVQQWGIAVAASTWVSVTRLQLLLLLVTTSAAIGNRRRCWGWTGGYSGASGRGWARRSTCRLTGSEWRIHGRSEKARIPTGTWFETELTLWWVRVQMAHQSQAKWVLKVNAFVDSKVACHLGGCLSETDQVVVSGKLVWVKGKCIKTWKMKEG